MRTTARQQLQHSRVASVRPTISVAANPISRTIAWPVRASKEWSAEVKSRGIPGRQVGVAPAHTVQAVAHPRVSEVDDVRKVDRAHCLSRQMDGGCKEEKARARLARVQGHHAPRVGSKAPGRGPKFFRGGFSPSEYPECGVVSREPPPADDARIRSTTTSVQKPLWNDPARKRWTSLRPRGADSVRDDHAVQMHCNAIRCARTGNTTGTSRNEHDVRPVRTDA